eukprot:1627294-Rhodomonas_salina.5
MEAVAHLLPAKNVLASTNLKCTRKVIIIAVASVQGYRVQSSGLGKLLLLKAIASSYWHTEKSVSQRFGLGILQWKALE